MFLIFKKKQRLTEALTPDTTKQMVNSLSPDKQKVFWGWIAGHASGMISDADFGYEIKKFYKMLK